MTDSTGRRPWIEGYPELVGEATDFLEERLNPQMMGFEWGSGGSTIWFSQRLKRLVSVDHDPKRYGRLKDRLFRERLRNVGCKFVTQGVLDGRPDWGEYAQSILYYRDKSFDLICINGKARPRCLICALPKLKISGILVLNNSESYRGICELLSKWSTHHFERSWRTTIFIKTHDEKAT